MNREMFCVHHLSRDYRSPAKCARCGGRHHTSICKNSHTGSQGSRPQQRPQSPNQVSSAQQAQAPSQLPATPQVPQPPTSQSDSQSLPPSSTQQLQTPSHQQTRVAEQPLSPSTQLFYVKTQVPVLLQTGKAYMLNFDEPQRGMTVRLMLDGGSQRSYMTQRIKDELGLQPEHIEQVQIKTFGSDTTSIQTVEVGYHLELETLLT